MRKLFLIILLTLILFSTAASVQAARTIIAYPRLPGAPVPTEGVPQFIKYIFVFSLGIVGIVGLIAIIIAAFQYVTSVGNPQKAAEAKDRIFSALLGILLLLGSYLILNTINPDLLKLKVAEAPVEIEVDLEEKEEVCQPINAYWEDAEIDVGETTYLVFTLNEKCSGQEATVEIFCDKGFRRQDRPRGTGCVAGGTTGWDPYCDIYYTGIRRAGHNDDGLILLRYEHKFSGQCRGKDNITECPAVAVPLCLDGPRYTGEICNFKESNPEIIYVEGRCNMQDGTVFYVPKTSGSGITVRDLEDDDTCCK